MIISGTAGNGLIYYGDDSNNGLFSITNPLNPFNVEIQLENVINDNTNTVNVCVNTNQVGAPVSGVNLAKTCPTGAFNSFTNDTSTPTSISKLKFNRKSHNSNSNDLHYQLSQKLSEKMENMNNNNILSVNLSPSIGNSSSFIVDFPGVSTDVSFTLKLSGEYCSDPSLYPIRGNCIPIQTINFINNTANLQENIPANSWSYFEIIAPSFSTSQINSINVTYDNTNQYSVYLQQNYIPNEEWFLPITPINSPSNGLSQIIFSPTSLNESRVYFLAIENLNETNALMANISISLNICSSANNIGPNCNVDTTSEATDGSGIPLLDVINSAGNNGVNTKSFDLSSSPASQYAYFQVTNVPKYETPYFIRLSVGNNNLDSNNGIAPTIYTKYGGYPSAQSFNSFATGGNANQVYLPIYDVNSTTNWFVAVQLPADFSIWIGSNCANNCSNDGANDCQCSNGNVTTSCQVLTNYGENVQPLFVLPTTNGDSAGVCECVDSEYINNFDCKREAPWALYIIVIIILVLLVIGVAIGVPVYVYITNKKRHDYMQI